MPRPRPSRPTRAVLLGALGVACVLGLAALLVVDLRGADPARMLRRPGWLAAACVATAVSVLAAVHNLAAFTPRRLPLPDTLRAQLAVCGLRVVAPSALSTPAVCTRFLTRSGLGVAQSMAVVGTAQGAQLLMTIVVLAGLAALGAHDLATPDAAHLAWYASAGAAAVGLTAVLASRVPALRRAVGVAGTALADVVAHVRAHPLRALGGLGASAALTLAHVGAFACCVIACGGHAGPLSLAVIYLGAASAGSLVPTPGGLGAVEAAMIAGLAAAGLDAPTAAAATLLSRLIAVWLPAAPGVFALRSLRRQGLL